MLRLNREATNTNIIVFGFTRSGLQPTIYRTPSEHANHYINHYYYYYYNTDDVLSIHKIIKIHYFTFQAISLRNGRNVSFCK